MCGICGVVALHGALAPDVGAAVARMTDTLRHRGPDGTGLHAHPRAVLGHTRLAIIDRAGGQQPLSNEDGTLWVVFNGEIYNHRALRVRLEGLGHRFRTTSDTEVIVHAYEEFGERAVSLLEGMFAFAVYDERRHELFMARDRLGKKPLYHATFDGVLHFGSEMRALRASPLWNGDVAREHVEAYFALGYLPAPLTLSRHVQQLPAGCWLRARRGEVEVRPYWDVQEFDTDHRPESAVVADIEALIRTAVRDRLDSEVPLGAFLSGGLDSALVVSFMAEALPAVHTTTVGFDDPRHDERAAAEVSARHLGTQHTVEYVHDQIDSVFATLLDTFDEPMADSSAIPTACVAAAARRQVTVALTGDGGDEVFGGYGFRYVPHLLESRARDVLPWAPLRQFAGAAGRAWPRSPHLPKPLRLGSLLENLARDPETAYYVDLCFAKPADTQALLGLAPGTDVRASEAYELIVAPYRRCASAHPLQRAQYADLKGYLANDVLPKVDRMSMRYGLEIRCPLLDHRLVEMAFRIPATLKHKGLTSKYLLRAVARKRLPPALLHLPKRGFTAPVAGWFRGPAGRLFERDVLAPGAASSAFVDQRVLRGAWAAHQQGAADRSYLLWAAWVFDRWLRHDHTAPGAPTR